jgi:hypothetical protein
MAIEGRPGVSRAAPAPSLAASGAPAGTSLAPRRRISSATLRGYDQKRSGTLPSRR